MANFGREFSEGVAAFQAARQRKRQNQQQDLTNLLVQAKIVEALRRTAAQGQPTAAGFVRDPVSGRMLRDPNYFSPELERQKAMANVGGQLAAFDAYRQPAPSESATTPSDASTPGRSLGRSLPPLIPTGMSGRNLTFGFDPVALAAQKTKQVEITKSNLAKRQLRREIAGPVALESTIPRIAEGRKILGLPVERLALGTQNWLAGVLQTGPIGENINTYNQAKQLLTPRMAKAAGDAANISVAEREFSQGIFPNEFDSAGTAERKREFLHEFSRALDNKNKNVIKQLLDKHGIPYYDLNKNQWMNQPVGTTPAALGGPSVTGTSTTSTAFRDLRTLSNDDLQRRAAR